MKKTVTLSEDEAKLLAICFGNYHLAVKAYDNYATGAGDSVVISGTALLAAQRIFGVELARPDMVEGFIEQVRADALAELED